MWLGVYDSGENDRRGPWLFGDGTAALDPALERRA